MTKPKVFTKILNPTKSAYTTHRRALQYVQAGRATWEGNAIRLTDAYVRQCKQTEIHHYIKASRLRTMDEAGYDGVGQMTLDQMQGLPLAGPAEKLIMKGSSRFVPRAPHCKVTVLSKH